jgi:hypothetical protein
MEAACAPSICGVYFMSLRHGLRPFPVSRRGFPSLRRTYPCAAQPAAVALHRSAHRQVPKAHLRSRPRSWDASNAAPLLFGANRRRVLDSKHMAPGNTPQGARRRGFDHFADADRLVARIPRDFDLARAVCAKPAYPDYAAPNRNQPVEQKDPPFSRRRSPNLPSVTSIMARSLQQNHSSSDSHRVFKRKANQNV